MSAPVLRLCAPALLAGAALVLVACVPLPIPPRGYALTSRTNLPDRQPEFIVSGMTTRQEVLLQLGSPDSEANDGSWFAYNSLRDEGGYALVISLDVGVGSVYMVERRLVVRFDADSVMTHASFKEVHCRRGTVDFTRWDTGGCLPLADSDSALSDVSVQTEAETPLVTFENMWFIVPNARTTDPGQPPLSRLFRGTLSLTQHTLLLEAKSSVSLDNPPLPKLRIPYTAMTELRERRSSDGRLDAVEMYSRSGFVYTIPLRYGGFEKMIGPVPSEADIERFVSGLQSSSGLTLRGP